MRSPCQKQKIRVDSQRFKRPYNIWCHCYDWFAHVFSFGLIKKTKKIHLSALRPGNRVLYPGVGLGAELMAAVQMGAQVTGIDIAPKMVNQARSKLAKVGSGIELLGVDVLDHQRPEFYDLVVVHYFLNLYKKDDAVFVLRHLVEQLKKGGLIFIADFATPKRSPKGFLAFLYYWTINIFGAGLGLAELHSPHEYGDYFSHVGVRIIKSQQVGLSRGPALFQVWLGEKL